MKRISLWVGAAVVAGGVAVFSLPDDPMPVQARGEYQFVVYDSSLQQAIDALGIVSDWYRAHPSGSLRLTNKDGNIPMDSTEIVALSALDVIFVPSGKIGEYLNENGWNEERPQ